ncbi:MAG: hypothetical protein C0179_01165 [Fervidicoccus sp.]|nr:MAG: hypothetical protein C0179_01165 [Fervidicoccus sp.]
MSREQKEETPHIVYEVPPSVDPETWANIQSKSIDVRLREIEFEREKTNAYVELAREGMNILEEYYLKKIPRITLPAYILVGAVVVGATMLTWLGRVSGETFAFLMGTIVGYIISILSKHI